MALLDLVTLADVKASLGLTVTTYDADLESYIEAATPVIENITGPIVERNVTYTVDGGRGAIVLPTPFSALVSIVESGVTVTDTVADGAAGVIHAGTTVGARCFAGGRQNVTVTVKVGVAYVPANVALAARELIRFWWQQGRQGNRPQFGNEGTYEPDVPSGFAVPRRVIELLQANSRLPGFA